MVASGSSFQSARQWPRLPVPPLPVVLLVAVLVLGVPLMVAVEPPAPEVMVVVMLPSLLVFPASVVPELSPAALLVALAPPPLELELAVLDAAVELELELELDSLVAVELAALEVAALEAFEPVVFAELLATVLAVLLGDVVEFEFAPPLDVPPTPRSSGPAGDSSTTFAQFARIALIAHIPSTTSNRSALLTVSLLRQPRFSCEPERNLQTRTPRAWIDLVIVLA